MVGKVVMEDALQGTLLRDCSVFGGMCLRGLGWWRVGMRWQYEPMARSIGANGKITNHEASFSNLAEMTLLPLFLPDNARHSLGLF